MIEILNEDGNKWIPVEERLPKPHIDSVYIWPRPDFGQEIHTGIYTSTKNDPELSWYCSVYETNWGMEEHKINVTHWMPIPEPPKGN